MRSMNSPGPTPTPTVVEVEINRMMIVMVADMIFPRALLSLEWLLKQLTKVSN